MRLPQAGVPFHKSNTRAEEKTALEILHFEHNQGAAQHIASFYDTPPLAYIHSFGCQQNVNDGEKIKGVLADVGFGLCDAPEQADLILFNTCAVREHAEQRVFGNVGALKSLKEKNPKPYHLLGDVYSRMGDEEKALLYWELARRLEKGSSDNVS